MNEPTSIQLEKIITDLKRELKHTQLRHRSATRNGLKVAARAAEMEFNLSVMRETNDEHMRWLQAKVEKQRIELARLNGSKVKELHDRVAELEELLKAEQAKTATLTFQLGTEIQIVKNLGNRIDEMNLKQP